MLEEDGDEMIAGRCVGYRRSGTHTHTDRDRGAAVTLSSLTRFPPSPFNKPHTQRYVTLFLFAYIFKILFPNGDHALLQISCLGLIMYI